jgi:hypothetical protein
VNKLATVGVSIVIAFGCKKAADLSKYKDRATALAAKYAPKLADLSKELPGLASHAKDLPVNVPGADKVGKLLEENKSTLESAQDILKNLPAKLGSDSPEQAEKDLAEAEKALAADVAVAEKDEKDIETAEKAAAAAPPAGSAAPPVGSAGSAAPPAGSGAGSAKPAKH